jgi:hypothetical protein
VQQCYSKLNEAHDFVDNIVNNEPLRLMSLLDETFTNVTVVIRGLHSKLVKTLFENKAVMRFTDSLDQVMLAAPLIESGLRLVDEVDARVQNTFLIFRSTVQNLNSWGALLDTLEALGTASNATFNDDRRAVEETALALEEAADNSTVDVVLGDAYTGLEILDEEPTDVTPSPQDPQGGGAFEYLKYIPALRDALSQVEYVYELLNGKTTLDLNIAIQAGFRELQGGSCCRDCRGFGRAHQCDRGGGGAGGDIDRHIGDGANRFRYGHLGGGCALLLLSWRQWRGRGRQ